MQSKASDVASYLKELSSDRRAAMEAVRAVILKNIDAGFQESMQYGMIGYSVPHSIYPNGYHCDPKQPLSFAALASQKNYMSLYVCSAYGDPEIDQWIRNEFQKAGKKLDMGKCCIRFKSLEELPLEVIARLFQRITLVEYVNRYEAMLRESHAGKKGKSGTKVAAKAVDRPLPATSHKQGESSKAKSATKGSTATKAKPTLKSNSDASKKPKKSVSTPTAITGEIKAGKTSATKSPPKRSNAKATPATKAVKPKPKVIATVKTTTKSKVKKR